MARKTDLREKNESNDTETNGWKNLVLAVIFLVATLLPCLCHAEEQLFMDGNPHYPLVFAMENYRHYLDLNSCTIISDNEEGFEISAEYIEPKSYNRQKVVRRFRKNEESDGELQV